MYCYMFCYALLCFALFGLEFSWTFAEEFQDISLTFPRVNDRSSEVEQLFSLLAAGHGTLLEKGVSTVADPVYLGGNTS